MEGRTVPAGTRIGDFEVEALLGRGGMGEVYRARQVGLDRPVALKVLLPGTGTQPEFAARFVREAGTLRDLEHPSIVPVYAAGEQDGRLYLAMRLVNGYSARRLLEQRGRLDPGEALSILRPVADALDYAHSRGVIHRDVKPANVLLDADGRVFLADFGIAKPIGDPGLTADGSSPGTPLYMPPEQAGGRVSHRSDSYALGCLAFELLTGTPPYRGDGPLPPLAAHATQPVPRASERYPALPRAVDDVFARALAKDPAQRFPSAGELIAGLGAALVDQANVTQPVVAAPTTVAAQPARPVRRRRLLGWLGWAGGAAALAALAVLGVVLLTRGGTPAAGPAPASAAQSGPPAPPTAVPRGELVYAAALDGTGASFADQVGRPADPARAAVEFRPGVLELAVRSPDGNAGTDVQLRDGVSSFVGDLDFSVEPGSKVSFCWGLRWAVPGKLGYQLCVDTAAESAQLVVWNGQQNVPIGRSVGLAGLQQRRVVHATVIVRPAQLTLLIDDQIVTDVTDRQVPEAVTIPGLDAYGQGGTGTVLVRGLRLSRLATG